MTLQKHVWLEVYIMEAMNPWHVHSRPRNLHKIHLLVWQVQRGREADRERERQRERECVWQVQYFSRISRQQHGALVPLRCQHARRAPSGHLPYASREAAKWGPRQLRLAKVCVSSWILRWDMMGPDHDWHVLTHTVSHMVSLVCLNKGFVWSSCCT